MKMLAVSIAIALLSGCATEKPAAVQPLRVLNRERVEKFIIKGKTTKSQVIAEFGWPKSSTITATDLRNGAHEILTYSEIYFTGSAILMVYVDRAGIVTNYIFSGSGVITQ